MDTHALTAIAETDAVQPPLRAKRLRPAPRFSRDVDGALVLSISDAAAHFGVSRRTIYNWIAAGKLPLRRQPGGAPRVVVQPLTAAGAASAPPAD